ncbi:MAG: tetratricopeptide repeat protein [bacterium]
MMRGTIRKIVICAAVWSASVVWAQGDGGRAGSFLRYGIGGRALGMGRAFVSVADDASGIYWNPAGLVGAKRIELATMYSNLYFDSQYAHFGAVFPRLGGGIRNGFLKFLFGPATAWGFGWIGLTTTGYEQRRNDGYLLGNFDIGENAFLAAWSREEVGSWGILRYGVSVKFMSQQFSGLQSSPSMDIGDIRRDWSRGIDVGFTFQPIHAPIFRVFSLRYLVPLRLGFIVQNALQPRWTMTEGQWDYFPRIFRWGLSYRWVLKDWIPATWESLRSFVGNTQILTVFDHELSSRTKAGKYFGIEGNIPLSIEGLALFPRMGFNNQSEGMSLGMGLSLPFTSSALVRIDYTYGFHPYLPEDNRLFLTVQMGRKLDAAHFKAAADREDANMNERRKYLYRILSEYPNAFVSEAAETLVGMEDSTRARRYYDLTGGLGKADWLFEEAKNLLRQTRIERARKKATDAADEYASQFQKPEHVMNDEELLNYGESLIIAHRMEEAAAVLVEVEQASLRSFFLRGVCEKSMEDWEGAIEMFSDAVKRYETEQDSKSMVCLSFLGIGEALIRNGQYESALTTLEIVLKNYSNRLNSDYPRYPIFRDDYIVDDAVTLMGICHLLLKHYEEGISWMLKTQRFYPGLEHGILMAESANALIDALDSKNWERLDDLVQRLLEQYFEMHRWPARQ